jgi:hypothetical protein
MTTQPPVRVYLDVPYADKDAAKAAGARWDPGAKRWHDPHPGPDGRPRPALAQWAAQPDVSELLPGEDREFGSGLFVDMVPESCWFTNVRTCVDQRDWERLRRMITGRAGHRCEVCGRGEDRATQRWLEAHERWHYDEQAGVQTLRRLVCLCSSCHLATHMGYANVTGRSEQAIAHLRAVTGMTHAQAMAHIDAAGQLWSTRSARTWALDLSMLTDGGVRLARPETPAGRAATAERRLCEEHQNDRTPAPRTPPAAPPTIPAARQPEPPTPAPVPEAELAPMKPIYLPYRSERRRTWLDKLLNRS